MEELPSQVRPSEALGIWNSEDPSFLMLAVSDSNYMARCSVAIESSGGRGDYFVLTLDSSSEKIQEFFPKVEIVRYNDVLLQQPRVNLALLDRSFSERIFSATPSVLLSLAGRAQTNQWLIYCDSDIYFTTRLEDYLPSHENVNVIIAPHRHMLWNRRRLAKFGNYNVGLVAFRNNEEGLRALRFWAESCLEWCYDRAEDGKYADQKYLEKFASVSEGVFVDNSLGVNLAPWNSFLKKISATKSGEIFVGRDKLLYFHAQGLKHKNGRWILGHLNYLSFAGPRLKKLVYGPYLAKLEEWSQKPGFEAFGTSRIPTTLLGRLTASLMYSLSLLTGQTIKVGTTRSEAQE